MPCIEIGGSGAKAVAHVVEWLRSDDWADDSTWAYYASAIADDIEKTFLAPAAGQTQGGQDA